MKKKNIFLILLAWMWMSMAFLSYAQETDAVLENILTDNLTSMEDVKWYCFEMSEPGDAKIVIRGLQDHWDGWNSHWAAVIYSSDLQTVLAEGTARGYNAEYSPPTEFSLLELESGTYYIRISSASTTHFTTDSYQLELDRTYSSTQPFADSGDGMYVIGTAPFVDRLISKDQVRWYAFEMTEYGDAIIVVTGLQEEWDGYSYHWRSSVYEDDLESVIVCADVRGYSENDGPTILCAPKLEAGTYYVQMKSTSSVNPLATTFTTEPYQIQLLRGYHSASVSYDENGFQTFQKAGDVLGVSNGCVFLKLNDGECIGTLKKSDKGIVPVLLGTDKASVEYVNSSTGEISAVKGPWHHDGSNIDYYYSGRNNIEKIADELEKANFIEENGETAYWLTKLKENWGVIVVIIIIAFVVLAVIMHPASASLGEGSYSSGSGYGGSYSSQSAMHDDLDALSAAVKRTEKYGPDWGDWDPEGPGPDPERPGPDPEVYSNNDVY